MSVIDFHTHAFPDSLAERAIASLEAAADWKAHSRGTVKELLASMDAADIDVSVVCTIATKPDQVKGILKWCKQIRSDRIDPLPSVHPQDAKAAGWIATFADEGYAGIKMHPMYQEFAADEPRLDPIYQAASDEGMFVVMHCGLDVAYPPSDDRASPARFARVIEKFPGLKLVCTHMGGWRAWDQVEQHLLGKNVYLETSFSLRDLGPQRASDMILRHGVNRVLMGSDWPWNTQQSEIAAIQALPLEEAQKQKILFSNAGRLLND